MRAVFFALLTAALLASPASAVSALFDFEDFPLLESTPNADREAVVPSNYGCNSKTYCTYGDLWDFRWQGLGSNVMTTRNGIEGFFARTIGSFKAARGGLYIGNYGLPEIGLYRADFDADLRYAEAFVSGTPERSWVDDFSLPELGYAIYYPEDYELVLRLWSGPGLTGDLVAESKAECIVPTGSSRCSDTLSIQLPSTESFRSMSFGLAWKLGDCREWSPGCTNALQGSTTDILVSPVPEPGTGVLLGLGLAGLARRRQWRQRAG